jgi:hypothetical protein
MKKLIFSALILAGSTGLACPNGTKALPKTSAIQQCELSGTYLSSTIRLRAGYEYVINGGVFFGEDNSEFSTLVIEPGVTLRGLPGSFISIMRGSKIEAVGTLEQPIRFTSIKESSRKRGEWGGLVINGNAPINACKAGAAVCEAISEGIKEREVKFGGNISNDNSGTLNYVVVEYAGYPIAQDNELNGITFNGVGSETVVEHIQVHMNSDDGIEFFGGTVNAKYVVLTANEDDSLDWDMGWTGKVQFLIIDQGNDKVDNGIEADNNKSPMNASPRSNPTISNMTMIGSKNSAYGLLLRRGTGAHIVNTVVSGFGKACVDIDDAETFNNGASKSGSDIVSTGLKFESTIFNCAKPFESENGDVYSTQDWLMADSSNAVLDPQLKGWLPSPNSPVFQNTKVLEDYFFEPTDFSGAFGSENWALGWTVNSVN